MTIIVWMQRLFLLPNWEFFLPSLGSQLLLVSRRCRVPQSILCRQVEPRDTLQWLWWRPQYSRRSLLLTQGIDRTRFCRKHTSIACRFSQRVSTNWVKIKIFTLRSSFETCFSSRFLTLSFLPPLKSFGSAGKACWDYFLGACSWNCYWFL